MYDWQPAIISKAIADPAHGRTSPIFPDKATGGQDGLDWSDISRPWAGFATEVLHGSLASNGAVVVSTARSSRGFCKQAYRNRQNPVCRQALLLCNFPKRLAVSMPLSP